MIPIFAVKEVLSITHNCIVQWVFSISEVGSGDSILCELMMRLLRGLVRESPYADLRRRLTLGVITLEGNQLRVEDPVLQTFHKVESILFIHQEGGLSVLLLSMQDDIVNNLVCKVSDQVVSTFLSTSQWINAWILWAKGFILYWNRHFGTELGRPCLIRLLVCLEIKLAIWSCTLSGIHSHGGYSFQKGTLSGCHDVSL